MATSRQIDSASVPEWSPIIAGKIFGVDQPLLRDPGAVAGDLALARRCLRRHVRGESRLTAGPLTHRQAARYALLCAALGIAP